MGNEVINAHIPSGTFLTVDTVHKSKSLVFYSRISRLTHNRNKEERVDLIDILGTISKAEYQVFLGLKNNMNYKSNICKKQTTNLTKSQKDTYKIRLNGLVKAGLIKSGNNIPVECDSGFSLVVTKKEIMINPNHLVPPNDCQVNIFKLWDTL